MGKSMQQERVDEKGRNRDDVEHSNQDQESPFGERQSNVTGGAPVPLTLLWVNSQQLTLLHFSSFQTFSASRYTHLLQKCIVFTLIYSLTCSSNTFVLLRPPLISTPN